MQLFSVKLLLFPIFVFLFPILFTRGIVGNFGDIYQYAAPFRYFAATSLQEGILPLWNPYIFAGTPFLASPQSALFYPLSALSYFLPLNYAFNYTAVLHIFFSSLGMFLLLSFIKFSRSASILGTLLWGFSFFPLSKLAAGHIIHLTGYSWVPWIFLFGLNLRPSTTKMIPLLSLILASALQFFSGHLHVWVLTTVMLFILIFWQSVMLNHETPSHWLKISLLYLICFLSLTAIQFLPSFNYLLRSMRGIFTDSSSLQAAYLFATSYSLEKKDLLTLLIPDYFGNPIQGNYKDPLHPSVYFETNVFYFGVLPFFFALGGTLLSIKRKKFFLPALIFFFTLLALGKNSFLYNWFWELLSFLRVPARFFFLSFFCMVCAAVIFWEHYLKKMRTTFKILLFFVILLDLLVTGRKFIWSENHLEKIGRTETMEWMQEQLYADPRKTFQRIFTTAEIGNPNKTMFFRILNVNGYEAILQKSLLTYFAKNQGNEALLTTGVDLKNPEDPALQLFAIKYMITLSPLKSKHPLVYDNNQIRVYEERQPFSLLSSDAPLPSYNILKNNPNKWTILFPSAEMKSTKFFWSEAYYPGWKAWTAEGVESEVVPWKGYFQSLNFVGAEGKFRKIYLQFCPLDFTAGYSLTVVSVIVLALLLYYRKVQSDLIKY